jgi:hypothetical protein
MKMTYFTRFLIVSICGLTQIFFASYLLLGLFNLNFFSLPSDAMFIPGVLIILGSGYLCASYYFGDKKMNNILYDEYSALRYYKLGATGYALNGFGIFIIFSIQNWSNWDLTSANAMIYQIAALAWAIFGILMLIFSLGDLKESRAEAAY